MKIILIQHLNFINGSGGTEKICCFLANDFASRGHEVEIATNQNISGKPMFSLHTNVIVKNIYNPATPQKNTLPLYNYKGKNPLKWLKFKIEKKKAKQHNKKMIAKQGGEEKFFISNLSQRANDWKKYLNNANPNIVITMSIGSLLEITYNNNYDFPIINSTNGRPDYDYTDILWYRSAIEMKLLKEAYGKLSAIQVLFESYKDYLPKTFSGKIAVIPNPVPPVTDHETVVHHSNKDRFKIINIASLAVSCKQQDVAIQLFTNLNRQFPQWDLHFWGVGKDKDDLKDKIKKLKLKDRIFLNGFTKNPIAELCDADIFIFPSKYEGFPLALTEAMSVGLPCLGFASCSGVNELIINNENGFLAKTSEVMKMQLKALMESSELRTSLGAKAHEDMKKFSPQFVLEEWQKLILSLPTNS